jgi:Mlc titration factor MtfA (ptsG expression regulator)
MHPFVLFMVILAAVIFFSLIYFQKKKKPVTFKSLPGSYRKILGEQIPFYKQLNPEGKTEFETRVMKFLSHVRITGVKTPVEEMDIVFVAASAIIPIFGFKNWDYINLNEVLLYPDSFGHEFEQQGQHRNTLGMVGSGAMSNVMILSQHELRQAFINKSGKENVAIHEFVHLVDKTDGAVDGIPEFLLDKKYILPWLELMHKKIDEIIDDKSDINPYGATDQAEFFAVVSEYFFERPDLLKQKHPELYELLKKIFQLPEPVQINSESSS